MDGGQAHTQTNQEILSPTRPRCAGLDRVAENTARRRYKQKSKFVLFPQCFGYQLEDQAVLFVGAP